MRIFPFHHIVTPLFLCVVASIAFAAPTAEEEFHSRVVAIYRFEPHTLNKAEFEAKIIELDKFWAFIKADPAKWLPLLKRELADPSNSAFFFYDASKLLLSLSTNRQDQELALRSIPKVDLRGMDHAEYLRIVHWFARNGFDTRDAAFRILAFPDFKAFIPQHALMLGQNYALIYMLFPLDESIYLDDLISKLETETNVQSQKSLMLALWYTVTSSGDAALKRFAADRRKPSEARKYAEELLSRQVPDVGSETPSSASTLKEQRRKIMQRPISDEALIEFDRLTALLLAKLHSFDVRGQAGHAAFATTEQSACLSPASYGQDAAAGQFANVNGISMYYETYGTGAPLLLIRENSGSIHSLLGRVGSLSPIVGLTGRRKAVLITSRMS
ncbi:MAG TPA: hypothetical protein VNP04_18875 [Alphaproteobacteria bacterium]|nr:hypothetical protein [Alphaproteobacteria bacterium]